MFVCLLFCVCVCLCDVLFRGFVWWCVCVLVRLVVRGVSLVVRSFVCECPFLVFCVYLVRSFACVVFLCCSFAWLIVRLLVYFLVLIDCLFVCLFIGVLVCIIVCMFVCMSSLLRLLVCLFVCMCVRVVVCAFVYVFACVCLLSRFVCLCAYSFVRSVACVG